MPNLTSEQEVREFLRAVVPGAFLVEDFNEEVQEIMDMCRSSERLSRLSLNDLTNYLAVLGHHLIYLDTTYTTYRLLYTSIKNNYEKTLANAMIEMHSLKGTVAEKEAQVLKVRPHLEDLREEMKGAELLKNATEDKVNVLIEFLNTLKRKQDVLELEAQNQYRTNY